MQLSKRCEYALRALIDLGLAHAAGRSHVPLPELAAHENLPARFLEQILQELRARGWVGSRRGQAGGYALEAHAEAISIGDVVRHFEGPLAPIRCASVTAYERCSCPDEEHCGLRLLMVEARAAISRVLDAQTLADVVAVTRRTRRRAGLDLPFLPPEGDA